MGSMVTKGQGQEESVRAEAAAATRMTASGEPLLAECECLRCGWKWKPRKQVPRSCPACRSYLWDQEAEAGTVRRRGE